MYKLYSIPGTCSTGVNILLKTLKQDVEIIHPSDVDDYSLISPTGQVPALDDNGKIITEGAAIALYLIEKHQSEFLAGELPERVIFLRWLMFNYATLHPSYSKMFAISSIMEDGVERDALLQSLADGVSGNWDIIDQRLAIQQYVYGDTPTIIDYLVCIYASWNNFFPGQTISLGANVEDLISRVSKLPEFVEAYARESAEYEVG